MFDRQLIKGIRVKEHQNLQTIKKKYRQEEAMSVANLQ
jgi:hypothetical protein